MLQCDVLAGTAVAGAGAGAGAGVGAAAGAGAGAGMGSVLQVVSGYYHTLLLLHTGHVVGFGRNDYGQLGLGHTQPRVFGAHVLPSLRDKSVVHVTAGKCCLGVSVFPLLTIPSLLKPTGCYIYLAFIHSFIHSLQLTVPHHTTPPFITN